MTSAGANDLARAAEALAERIPEPLAPLARLAFNYRWTWEPGAAELFRAIDPARFERLRGNAVRLLRQSSSGRLERAASDPDLVRRAAEVEARLREELEAPAADRDRPVAFFCAEFGVHPSLPIYSGGLGVLAGDLLKETSDRRIPMVGIGILYATAVRQRLDATGWQHDYWSDVDPDLLPAAPVTGPDGDPITVRVGIRGRDVAARVWRVDVGRTPLFLLDANRPENHVLDRWITTRLYMSDRATRLAKYVLLGAAGVRALRAMGVDPAVIHLNEGHAAFAPLAWAAEEIAAGRSRDDALEDARARTVFTTHTPVPAGNEAFDPALVAEVATELPAALEMPLEELLGLGRLGDGGEHDRGFGITTLGLRTSRTANGVSRRHGEVARAMWHDLFPDLSLEEVPIGHVTNGVHLATWMAAPMRRLLDRYLGEGWGARAADPATWEPLEDIPDAELWEARRKMRAELVAFLRERHAIDRLGQGDQSEDVAAGFDALDPDALTLGFARRVAAYKRLGLLVRDPERLAHLLVGPPSAQIVLAGKAHHQDLEGKGVLRSVFELRGTPGIADRLVFVQDYDMTLAARLVAGCDVWVNVPRPPMEASGTSGMKSALNGGLNVSVLDGWWAEAYDGDNGWAVGDEALEDPEVRDEADATALYELLERQVVPLFRNRDAQGVPVGWIRKMKASLQTNGPRFGTGRMLQDYLATAYRIQVR